jgi:RNA recognition motif-containing protein
MAYVTFAQPSAAVAAYESLDKTSFQGRLLHILAAVNRKGNFVVEEAEGQKKQSLKEERNAKRKAAAGREFNWSMLYMNVRRRNFYVKLILLPNNNLCVSVDGVFIWGTFHVIERCRSLINSGSYEDLQV